MCDLVASQDQSDGSTIGMCVRNQSSDLSAMNCEVFRSECLRLLLVTMVGVTVLPTGCHGDP